MHRIFVWHDHFRCIYSQRFGKPNFAGGRRSSQLRAGYFHKRQRCRGDFKLAVQKLPAVVNEALEKAELSLEDIDLFIPHQANLRINQFFQKSMKLPEDKVFHNIQRYGNTTAASIPIALDEAIEMNLIGDGSTVLFLGLGSGLTWGAVISKLVD